MSPRHTPPDRREETPGGESVRVMLAKESAAPARAWISVGRGARAVAAAAGRVTGRISAVLRFGAPAARRQGYDTTAPRVLITWALLAVAITLLLGKGLIDYAAHDGVVELALSAVVAILVASAVINARVAGVEVERRNSEAESFSRIMQALSRSVSPDAVVEAIVHELGAATAADHVAVVRLRPGSTSLDVTFVSMLPGTPTSNTVMPLRQLEPLEARRLRRMPRQHPSRMPLRFLDGEPAQVWRDTNDRPADPAAAADEATKTFRRNIRMGPQAFPVADDESQAIEVADRIAYSLRYVYGLSNTLAAPLQSGPELAGAIVLSRRTSDVWPESAVRLLNSAALEASAALARVYSHQAAASEARTDQLTQLPNRRYFDEYCRLLASRRRSSDRVSVVAVDVDHFKLLNDRYGHQVGDLVLRAIANAIQLSVREEDVPARFGGEEFVVLLRNPSRGIALEIGERIRRNVRDLDLREAGVTDRVTVSVGIASGKQAGEMIEDIVARADRALYAAKRTGRDRVVEAWHADTAQEAAGRPTV